MREALMLDFLSQLELHNNREWFHGNQELYRQAKLAFQQLVGELMDGLGSVDEAILPMDPASLTFKLMRDTRFSHDKSPYQPAFRAHIGPKGKLPVPVGYYLMIRPGNRSFLGGGLFADMFPGATALVRDSIAAHGEEWEQIIQAPEFTKLFSVQGTKLKNVPRGYDPEDPNGEYLKYKSWYVEYPVSDAQLLQGDFVPGALSVFSRMKPLNDFLNRALAGFEMPRR